MQKRRCVETPQINIEYSGLFNETLTAFRTIMHIMHVKSQVKSIVQCAIMFRVTSILYRLYTNDYVLYNNQSAIINFITQW